MSLGNDVNKAVEILTNELTQILDELAPIKVFQVRTNYAPWLTVNTKQWMKFRDSALDKAVNSRLYVDWVVFKKLRNKVNNFLKYDKKAWQQSKLGQICGDSVNAWKFTKAWLGWKSGGPPTKLCVNGVMVNKPILLAKILNEYFIDKVNKIVNSLPPTVYDPLKLVRKIMKIKSVPRSCHQYIQMK